MFEPRKLIELNPKEWRSSDRVPMLRGNNKAIAAVCGLLAFAVSFYARVLWTAPKPDHTIVPPGAYAWTPEHGLQPITSGSPPAQLPR